MNQTLREDAIRAGYTAELKPSTPYQMVLVSHLVDAEMDIQNVRSIKMGLLRDSLAECIEEAFSRHFSTSSRSHWSDATQAAMDPSNKEHDAALEQLRKRGLSLTDLVGRAYRMRSKQLLPLDLELDRAYRRRQMLRTQFDALSRAEALVEDADLVDG